MPGARAVPSSSGRNVPVARPGPSGRHARAPLRLRPPPARRARGPTHGVEHDRSVGSAHQRLLTATFLCSLQVTPAVAARPGPSVAVGLRWSGRRWSGRRWSGRREGAGGQQFGGAAQRAGQVDAGRQPGRAASPGRRPPAAAAAGRPSSRPGRAVAGTWDHTNTAAGRTVLTAWASAWPGTRPPSWPHVHALARQFRVQRVHRSTRRSSSAQARTHRPERPGGRRQRDDRRAGPRAASRTACARPRRARRRRGIVAPSSAARGRPARQATMTPMPGEGVRRAWSTSRGASRPRRRGPPATGAIPDGPARPPRPPGRWRRGLLAGAGRQRGQRGGLAEVMLVATRVCTAPQLDQVAEVYRPRPPRSGPDGPIPCPGASQVS